MNQINHAPPRYPEAHTGEAGGAPGQPEPRSMRQSVEAALDNYFAQLDGQMVTDVYDMVLAEVEAPLLEAVLKYTRNNQTLAATVLGLNRGTLRKKLKRYGML
jgi:Fis family transcriptional regulator